MTFPEIRLSVALVTRNRPESLERTLKSLRVQKIQPWEIIISDDSDNEYSVDVVALANKYDCRYLKGLQRGLYANRNFAALACRGTHIRTMDDDHEFPGDHIEKCLEAVKLDPKSIWVIGEFLSREAIAVSAPPCPGQLHPRGFSVTPCNPQNCWAIADGSCILPAAVFGDGNGYDESFSFGSSFLELGSRLFWLGYRIRFLESTYIIHHTVEFQQKGATVWSTSSSTAAASRIFAMLCHSFIYQPTLINKSFTCLQIAKDFAQYRRLMVVSLQVALPLYRNKKEHLKNAKRVSALIN